MARFLVVGSAHVDRVWRLSGPLVPGGRQRYERVQERYGGGAFHTGSVLLALGHRVDLMTALSGDAAGRRHRRALADRGFGLDGVETVDMPTAPLEILLDPAGERTILLPAVPRRTTAGLTGEGADLVYLNVRDAPAQPETLGRLAHRTVSQMPLDAGQRRPARILVASRADWPRVAEEDLLAHARAVAGPAFEALVLTAGKATVTILTGTDRASIPVPPLADGTDTTGAGDFFAAGLLDGLARGLAPAEAARVGAATAGRVLADRCRYLDDRIAE
ncbi:hypothetical protein STVA_21940 [Allostella vacuolata]|nr:hypothetical protein STVA_21940 [Stella vacuolata]